MPSFESYFPTGGETQVVVVIPKSLHNDAKELSQEDPLCHPAWGRIRQRREQLLLVTSELADVEELADFASIELVEPRKQPNKLRRDACKALIARCQRVAVLEPLADHHLLATAWKKKPR